MLKKVTICLFSLLFMISVSIIMWLYLPTEIKTFLLVSDDSVRFIDRQTIKFVDYTRKYNKSYGDEEFKQREQYFHESLKEISRLNQQHGSPVFGVNKFSDWSAEEKGRLVSSNNGLSSTCYEFRRKSCPPNYRDYELELNTVKRVFPPEQVDWRKEHVIGNVVDQKQCSGCWAITIVGLMESMWAIRKKELKSLSIQELLDCSTHTNGCNGGNINFALDFMCSADYSIVEERVYPLKLVDQSCQMPMSSQYSRRIKEFTTKCNMTNQAIQWQIADQGPVIAVVNAKYWPYYNSGVIRRACDDEWGHLKHAVQIVGYDLTGEVPYYLVRNSWGEDFGENGYVRVAIEGNVCGISSHVTYLSVK